MLTKKTIQRGKKYLRKIASHIDMNVKEFIVHAYPIGGSHI
jgi:hypothetical protein